MVATIDNARDPLLVFGKSLATISILFSSILLFSSHAKADAIDVVTVISQKEIIGPYHLRTSCLDIARFDEENRETSTAIPGESHGILLDSYGHKRQRFYDGEKRFNVQFLDWTPGLVAFLKNQVDECAVEAHSWVNKLNISSASAHFTLSPSTAKQLIDETYAIVVDTRRMQDEAEDRRKREQEGAAQQAAQGGQPPSNPLGDYMAHRPLPGLPDLQRSVFLNSQALICESPGALANPNIKITVHLGVCNVTDRRIKVSVFPPTSQDEYFQDYVSKMVSVGWRSEEASNGNINSGWVRIDDLTN